MKYYITATSLGYEESAVTLLKKYLQINEFNPTIEDTHISIELNTLEEFNEFCKRIDNEIIISHFNSSSDDCFWLEIYDGWRE